VSQTALVEEEKPAFEIVIPGDPIPWAAAVKMGGMKGPSKIPDRQARHAGKISEEFRRVYPDGLWLEKGTPVVLDCNFYVTRPKTTHYGSGRNERVLKPNVPARPIGRPDLSNMVKMIEDGLTKVLWADDDQVVAVRAAKHYLDWWEQPCSVVRVRVL
jgi:Holliday junction resolvase RusA-like endonuclease